MELADILAVQERALDAIESEKKRNTELREQIADAVTEMTVTLRGIEDALWDLSGGNRIERGNKTTETTHGNEPDETGPSSQSAPDHSIALGARDGGAQAESISEIGMFGGAPSP